MSVRNWSVSTKLIAAFSVLIAILLVQGGMIFSTVRTLNEADDTRARSLLVSNQTARVMTDVLEQMNAVRGYTLKGDPAFLKTYRENEAALRGLTAEMMTTTKRDVTRQRIETIQRAVAAWQAGKLQQTIALARNPATRVEAQTIAGSKQLGTIRDAITDLSDSQKARVAELDGVASRAEAQLHMVLWIGVAAAVVVAAAMAWLLSIGIVRPIVGMTTAMKRLAEGDYAVTIIGRDRGDEIGGMAQAVEVFRENGIAKDAADQAKTRADVEQRQMVETVSAHLSQLSSGDLTAAITEEFPAKYAALRTNFNDALGKLRDLIGAVSESATAIRTGSGEIAQASEDLARRTESNAASLEETAASVTQMDGRLRASATAATRTVERADQAIATVGGGRAVADQAVQAMGRVSESAKGIDSVIEGLDKIAFQTRVLAMNAAVEAGRAGDAGRGFAVVADLVSALAMRAEEEAKRARDQLTVTQTDIVTAVEAVTKVDGALANISGDVSQVHELLATMAADNQAQSAAITQISAAIGTMDQSTQQNAAMVEETSAAARNLVGEVGSLADQAGLFRITDRAGSSRTTRRPLPETLSSLVQQHG